MSLSISNFYLMSLHLAIVVSQTNQVMCVFILTFFESVMLLLLSEYHGGLKIWPIVYFIFFF